ncbi:hypothetical protein ACIRD8_37115 [Streptomyces sp. NPDC102451]|uniref:hypothetical protein n=1 Tax=Streptomyces sp. NPDC102451 TaxID=3366177 RepID=UPI00381194B3
MPAATDRTPFIDWLEGHATVTGHTADMRRDEAAPFGFTVHDTPLEPPEPGSIEEAFAETGLGLAIAPLGQARAENLGAPDRIRLQGVYQHTPVIDAFDGILCTPVSTTTDLEKP